MHGYADPEHFKFARGAILNRDLSTVHEVNGRDAAQVQEYVTHSWYEYSEGDGSARHPWEGETKLNYTGPKPPYEHLNVDQKYSWLKTPRWKGNPMEVGPLARMLVSYAACRQDVQDVVNGALKTLGVPVAALFSTLGRTAARGLETKLIAVWVCPFFSHSVQSRRNSSMESNVRAESVENIGRFGYLAICMVCCKGECVSVHHKGQVSDPTGLSYERR